VGRKVSALYLSAFRLDLYRINQLLSSNLFRKVGGGSQVNEERRFYVSREAIERVMDKAPNDEWKLLIALGRYGGLRIPSEEVGLKISDVDLERSRITIASPKTKKQGKAKRVIPLWPELRPLMETVIKKAAADQVRRDTTRIPSSSGLSSGPD
jgi:integrase